MSDPREGRLLSVEFRGETDSDVLEALAKWLRANGIRLDVTVIRIDHEYSDQYTPATLTAFVMSDD